MASLTRIRVLQSIAAIILLLLVSIRTHAKEQDLYELLGVSRTATTKEIKSAYRRKALETHPDKQPDIPAEEAAEAFQKIVNAFEILSDERTRRNYDMRANHQNGGRSSSSSSSYQQHRRQYYQPPSNIPYAQRMKIRQAQSRIIHITSLDQLKTLMLDDDGLLERNLLICFCTTGGVEDTAMYRIQYPYPFAGMSDGGVWYETILQTTMVTFAEENELTEFFGISKDSIKQRGQPMFVFGRRGQPLEQLHMVKLQTSRQDQFENWMWLNLEVKIMFTNHHPFTVEALWVDDTRAKWQFQLGYGESVEVNTRLSHEWWFRDFRVDRRPYSPKERKLSRDCLVDIFIAKSDEQSEYTIQPKECFDLSGHCFDWKKFGGCANNKVYKEEFLHAECPLSCHLCSDENDNFRANGFAHDEF